MWFNVGDPGGAEARGSPDLLVRRKVDWNRGARRCKRVERCEGVPGRNTYLRGRSLAVHGEAWLAFALFGWLGWG